MSLLQFFSAVLVFGITVYAAPTTEPAAQTTPDTTSTESISADTATTETDAIDEQAAATETASDTVSNPGTSAEADSSESIQSAVIEESEEELILDGEEESLLPIAPVTEEDVVSESQSIAADPAESQSDSVNAQPGASSQADTAAADGTPIHVPVVSPIPPPPEETVPLKIEQAKSINFANNFKEYRSPRLAILMSLFVPGAGQAYAHNYIKTGIFGAVEVTMITVGAILRAQGNSKWDKAKKFADDHYNLQKFLDYYTIIDDYHNDSILSIIMEPDSTSAPFESRAKNRNDDFYDDIRWNRPYIHGWDDATPEFDEDFSIKSGSDEEYFFDEENPYLVYRIDTNGDTTEYSHYGYSENQETYDNKLQDANLKYRWSQRVFTMLLINHIASAIDAGITAKAHNDRLLGKKSAWQRINIRDTYVKTPVGNAQGLALEVRF